jgi:hypothetical protein
MVAENTKLYKAEFNHPVAVEGTPYGGALPFQAAFLVSGEGSAFRRMPPTGLWDTLDLRLYDSEFDDSKSLPIKLTIAIPKGWETRLVIALIVKQVVDADTLQFQSSTGLIEGTLEWYMQDPVAVARFLSAQQVFQSIQSTNDTHLSYSTSSFYKLLIIPIFFSFVCIGV